VLIVSSPLILIVFEELLVKEPGLSIISSEPLSIVSVPVVSVNGIFSVTVTDPSMVILSRPPGSIPPLQFVVLDQFPVAPPTQTTIGAQTSTGWFPVIEPLVTPVQSLFIVPVLLMVPPAVLLRVPASSSSPLFMVPKLSMVPSALLVMVPKLSMMPPVVFDIVMVPELEKVLSVYMPTQLLQVVELDTVMVPALEKVPEMRMPSPPVFDIVMVPVAVLSMLELGWLLRPPLEMVPEFDISMSPELVRVPELKMPLPAEF